MVKNRIFQLVYLLVYIVMMAVGILCAFGLIPVIGVTFNPTFYTKYTNLSNYICLIIAIIELVYVIIRLSKGEIRGDDFPFTRISFLGTIWILITCLIYNFLLGDITSAEYWANASNPILHLFGPVMFVVSYVLFSKRNKLKWWDPSLVLTFPYAYLIFIFVRAYILNGEGDDIYPYFFLNVDNLGVSGVAMWIAILTVVFVGLGFILVAFNKIYKIDFSRKPKDVLTRHLLDTGC